ncbi:putative pentatricopeptide repeat-containing protein [Tanacetum coccineum]
MKEIEKRLKEEVDYAHEVRFSLHDVEEESREESLRVHSEKLALGLVLVHDDGVEKEEGKCIRIFKNLRVCGDCHEFIKGLSKITTKVFLVRDANRKEEFKTLADVYLRTHKGNQRAFGPMIGLEYGMTGKYLYHKTRISADHRTDLDDSYIL